MPESNLSGLGSAPDEPFSSSSSGSPEILGTNQLQVAIDKFDQAVNKLADLYSKARTSADASGLPGAGGGVSANANAGGPSFPKTSATPGSGIYSSAQAQPGQAASKTPGLNMWSSGGNGQGFINQFSFGGGSPGVTIPGGAGGGGGGGGLPAPGGGSAGWSSFSNAFASGGTSQLGTQVAFSNYLQSAYRLNAGAPGTGSNNQLLAQAVGRPGAWNTGAQSSADALAGTALMQQQAGSAALTGPGSSQYGRSMYGAAAATSYLTGSDWSQSSQLSSWLYQPMTSYRMMMMGFPQPTQPGGQGQTLGLQSVLFGINQRNFGRGTIDPKTASQFYSTRGVGYQELLQLTGGNTDMANQLASTDIGINQAVSVSKKRTGKQLDWNQVYGMLQGANTGNKSDRSTLDKLGITETEQRRLQDVSATKTGTQAELFNSFQSGLTAATAAANTFANVLQKILSLPGVNQIAGMSAGSTSIAGPLSFAKKIMMSGPESMIANSFTKMLGVPGGGSSGSGSKSGVTNTSGAAPKQPKSAGKGVTSQAKAAVADAQSQLGVPYVWGGETPGKGFDCCLVPWAMVQTLSGPVPIKDIKPRDLVFTWEDGHPVLHPVIALSEPRRQMTYRIKTNRRSLEASGNHPFHTVRTGLNKQARLEWTRLDELQPGDRIIIMDSLPDLGETPDDGLRSNPDYLWLLGAMFGDGHLSYPRKHVYLCMFGEQREYAREVLQSVTENKVINHPTHGLYVTDAALSRQLADDGLEKKSTERVIPGWVWRLPHKLIEVFLDGYTTADGSLSSTKNYLAFEYKAANEYLIRQVRNLHMVLGHNVSQVGKIERTKPIIIKGKTVKNARPLHHFEAYPESERKANGYLSGRPNVRKLFPSDCFMPEKILSIETLCEQDTYDIEVEGAHNFIAEGVNVHNSGLTQWSYQQAGVSLPRTSQSQWSFLSSRRRSVDLRKVQEGDLIFKAGSDGTGNAPGHVAMMISNNSYVEAEMTGVPIHDRPYNPREWQHAARPTGNTAGSSPGGVPVSGAGSKPGGSGSGSGNAAGGPDITGMGSGGGGSPSSTSEAENVAAGLAGGSMGGPGGTGSTSGGTGNNAPAGPGSSKGGNHTGGNVPLAGGGTPAKNRALGQKIAAAKFGWTGAQWSALDKLWGTYESGWNNNAQNPSSTAYGIAQFLDTTWAPYGKKTSKPGLQELYGMEYIRDRYKDPVHALAFELSHTPHWYSGGTNSAKAGAAVLGERGPEIALLSGGQKIFDAKQTQEMLQAVKRPAQTPWKTAPGGTGTAGGGNPVTLQFAPGSIVIGSSGDNSGTRWATANSAREFVRKVKKILEEEELNCAIATGQKAS